MSEEREERKKRILARGVKGWEEAGGEFYQESYPGADSDLELMRNDPQRIATLLPSKKNRSDTVTIKRKDNKLTLLRHRNTIKSHYQTTVGPNNDVQISFMPDLSENLSNEEILWEEIMKIKAMPVNMEQKKQMKMKLQSKDTLRLQGFKQFRWKHRQTWTNISGWLKELNEKFTLWRSSLKKIEGYHGTGVMSFFLFIKWLIRLNLIISIIIHFFIIIPTILSYSSSNSTTIDLDIQRTCSSNFTTTDTTDPFFEFVVGKGWVNKLPLYYSYYNGNNTSTTIDGFYFLNYYNLPLAYILTTFLYFSYSFILILKNAADGLKHRLLESEGQFYIYCNLIFSGWDFCIKSENSATVKRKALFNEIKGRLNMERRKEELRNRTRNQSFKLFFIRLIINVIILILLTGAGITIFFSYNYFSKKNFRRNGSEQNTELTNLIGEFGPVGLIIGFNIILPQIFHWLSNYEKFNPLFAIQVTVFRTILLRYSSLCVLLGSFYDQHGIVGTNLLEECWENHLAQELYKLLMLNLVTQVFVTFLLNFPRSFLANSKFCQMIGRQEFHLPTHILDIVYIQTIIWLGSFYAPLLPLFGVLIFVIVFHIKKFACLVNCRPAENAVYHASRSHNLFMFILLFSFAFSVIPWAFSIAEISPSKSYGPFKDYNTVWQIIEKTLTNFPDWIQITTVFCTRSAFIVPVLILLLLANYYYYAVYVANKQMVLVLKKQLVLEGHDKQFLLNRLSAFIRQQQEYDHRRSKKIETTASA